MTAVEQIAAEVLQHRRRMDVPVDMLAAVAAEHRRQDNTWGVSVHPNISGAVVGRSPHRVAQHYEIPSANRAKQLCNSAFRDGEGTWAHILIEEIAAAVEAAALHDHALRRGAQPSSGLVTELIQVAAVAVQWAEAVAGDQAVAVGGAHADNLSPLREGMTPSDRDPANVVGERTTP